MIIQSSVQLILPVHFAPAPDRQPRQQSQGGKAASVDSELRRQRPRAGGLPAPLLDLGAATMAQESAGRHDSAKNHEDGKRDANGLSDAERAQVAELKKIDREVRQHEQAHKAAAGPYGGGVSFEFVQGPDGQRYAVAGEVSIDSAPVPDDPEATIRKMEVVKRAALAPTKPSGQDRKVAAAAEQKRVQAQTELNRKRNEERQRPSADEAPGLSSLGFQNAANLYDRASETAAGLAERDRNQGFAPIIDISAVVALVA